MSRSHYGSATELIGKLETELGRSMTAMLEISDHCNEVCVHCYQVQGKKGEMTTEQVFSVLDDLADAGVLILTISGGEATLRSDFLDIVRYARERKFLIRLFTNGLRMDDRLARELAHLGVETVEISLYSHLAETHDFVTGVPGSFDKTVAGIRALVRYGVPVVVKTPVMSVNEHHIEAYRAFVADLGALLRMSSGDMLPREGGSGEPWAFNPSSEANMALEREHRGPKFAPASRKRSPSAPSCGAGRLIHVEANGELRPCSVLEIPLGDLTSTPLREAQQGNEALDGLLSLSYADLHGCRDCDISGHCNRCYAKARAETGDALGPHPSACAVALMRYEVQNGAPLTVRNAQGGSVTGPFRMTGEHQCEVAPDEVTAQDDALAARLGWSRSTSGRLPDNRANPGDLVQLRRPGRKKPLQEKVPTGVEGQGD